MGPCEPQWWPNRKTTSSGSRWHRGKLFIIMISMNLQTLQTLMDHPVLLFGVGHAISDCNHHVRHLQNATITLDRFLSVSLNYACKFSKVFHTNATTAKLPAMVVRLEWKSVKSEMTSKQPGKWFWYLKQFALIFLRFLLVNNMELGKIMLTHLIGYWMQSVWSKTPWLSEQQLAGT